MMSRTRLPGRGTGDFSCRLGVGRRTMLKENQAPAFQRGRVIGGLLDRVLNFGAGAADILALQREASEYQVTFDAKGRFAKTSLGGGPGFVVAAGAHEDVAQACAMRGDSLAPLVRLCPNTALRVRDLPCLSRPLRDSAMPCIQ